MVSGFYLLLSTLKLYAPGFLCNKKSNLAPFCFKFFQFKLSALSLQLFTPTKPPYFYTFNISINGSKAYSPGLLPDGSPICFNILLSSITLVNFAAVDAGIPLELVNLLLRKTGFVKIKSSALIHH